MNKDEAIQILLEVSAFVGDAEICADIEKVMDFINDNVEKAN